MGGVKSGQDSGRDYDDDDGTSTDGSTNNNNNNNNDPLLGLTQVEGVWPIEHPLPLPEWSVREKPSYQVGSIAEFNEISGSIESHLQKLLEEHNYNTVGNFISLYEGFQKSSCSYLAEFFQSYSPPVTSKHHTCVGLALELWRKLFELDQNFPDLTDHLYLVSCEESIGVFKEYAGLYGNIEDVGAILEKEHVLLAMKFEIQGRPGIVLCDPGYHVGRVITVMKDGMFPNTGWFKQSSEGNVTKEYNYAFSPSNNDFIEWYDRTSRNTKVEEVHSVVYIKRPYLTAVDVTERRNLVYSFRSLLSRDQKGHVVAGIYFKVLGNSDEFTLFYQDEGKQRIKLNFSEFKDLDRVNERILNIIQKCNTQLNFSQDQLLVTLNKMCEINNDKNYISQLLDINNCINDMTEVN